jgi:hypothetical protein
LIGVEAVDNMVLGTKEFTLLYPSLTNEVGTCAFSVIYMRSLPLAL